MTKHPCDNACRERRRSALMTSATMLGALVCAVAMLAGCASPGPAVTPKAALTAAQAGATGTTTPWPASAWWTTWGDAELSALIDTALQRQPALQQVQARLVQAQAAVDAAGAARAPQVNASAELTDQRFTTNGLIPPPLAGAVKWSNSATVGASWELDLFGRQRAALDAAIGQLQAGRADAQAARVLLASNVAAGYVNLARLVEARGLADQALAQREQVVTLVRQRISAGMDTTVDLRQAEGFIAQSRTERESLDEAIVRARHALAELTGQGPDTLATLSPRLAPVQGAPLPDALPADLLGRRADLVAQRWRVEAAARDVDVARAQFYPNVNLTAFIGLSSLGLDKFINAGSETYGVGPALHLPIFDGGRLRANLGAKRAEVDVAIEGYNAALLRALREVADELASLRSIERQQAAQADATKAAEAAFELSLQRYKAGLGNYLVVLTAETNVLAQRRAATDLRGRQLAEQVALIRALGGGYAADATTLPPTLAAAN